VGYKSKFLISTKPRDLRLSMNAKGLVTWRENIKWLQQSKGRSMRAKLVQRVSWIFGAALVAASWGLGQSVQAADSSVSAESNDGELQEIIVTAEKRQERLSDVPISVTAIEGDQLEALQITSLTDLAAYVPGLSIDNGGTPGQNLVVLRGLNTSSSSAGTASLTATYIDDSPVGTSSQSDRPAQIGLDMMPYDVERIEVLRGPQGTNYGADAMGGIIKYVLKLPDLTQFEVRAGADGSFTDQADAGNWYGRAAINIPLIADTLGVRASGFYTIDAGYTNNIGADQLRSNTVKEEGGRFSALWKPMEALSVQASFLIQTIHADDRSGVTVNSSTGQPIYGNYSWFSNYTEPYQQQTSFASLDINWDLGFANFTSVSSYSYLNSKEVRTDLTELFGQYTPGYSAANPALAYSYADDIVPVYAEEVRLTSKGVGKLQWMIGGLYSFQEPVEFYSLPTFNPVTRAPLPLDDNLYFQSNPQLNHTYDVGEFGNATYLFNKRWDLSAGIRYSQDRQTSCGTGGGVLLGGVTSYNCSGIPNQENITWMTNTRFHFDDDDMLYARVATGYRPGTGCATCGVPLFDIPAFTKSDSLISYEAGFKGDVIEHRLSIDADIFYINWSDIQITLYKAGFGSYSGNGSNARSSGAEFTSHYQATSNLRFDLTASFTNAHMGESDSAIGAVKGDALPDTARWSGALTTEYRWPLQNASVLSVGGGYHYRDSEYNQFPTLLDPYTIGPENIVDLHTGYERQNVTLRLYVRNLLNDHAYTGLLLLTNPQAPSYVPLQPRTVGLSVDYRLK
jgi:iron complex outermembrane recepter protein